MNDTRRFPAAPPRPQSPQATGHPPGPRPLTPDPVAAGDQAAGDQAAGDQPALGATL